jgi:hypothetical protein
LKTTHMTRIGSRSASSWSCLWDQKEHPCGRRGATRNTQAAALCPSSRSSSSSRAPQREDEGLGAVVASASRTFVNVIIYDGRCLQYAPPAPLTARLATSLRAPARTALMRFCAGAIPPAQNRTSLLRFLSCPALLLCDLHLHTILRRCKSRYFYADCTFASASGSATLLFFGRGSDFEGGGTSVHADLPKHR